MKKEQTQTKRNHQSKEEEATRQETKRKKTTSSNRTQSRKKRTRSHTKSLYGGFCEENTRDKKKDTTRNRLAIPLEDYFFGQQPVGSNINAKISQRLLFFHKSFLSCSFFF